MNILRSLYSRKNILNFWHENKSRFRRRTMPGVDGVSRDDFANTIEVQANDIAEQIASNTFIFQKLRPVAIPKDDGAIRLINVPTIRDRLVQRILLQFFVRQYGELWRIPQSFSSMGGEDEGVHRTLKEVAHKLRQTDFAIKADLSRYFDNIDRSLMSDVITRRVRHRSLHTLLKRVIACETSTKTQEDLALFRKSNLKKGHGLRQGMPLSPVFAFLFLSDVDLAVDGGFHRYVDDLLFFGPDHDAVKAQFGNYRSAVEIRGLKIHELGSPIGEPKTFLIAPSENFNFLGVRLNRIQAKVHFEIPRKSKMRIEQEILDAGKIDHSNKRKQKRWLLSAASRASNLVQNYRSAYHFCSDWNLFETNLKQLQLGMCRSIVCELSKVYRSNNTKLLRRLFGI